MARVTYAINPAASILTEFKIDLFHLIIMKTKLQIKFFYIKSWKEKLVVFTQKICSVYFYKIHNQWKNRNAHIIHFKYAGSSAQPQSSTSPDGNK